MPPLVGQAELVALFGLPSDALLRKAVSTGRLRPADYTLSGSPIWLLEPVVEDAPAPKPRDVDLKLAENQKAKEVGKTAGVEQAGWKFYRYFIVTSVVEPKDLKIQ